MGTKCCACDLCIFDISYMECSQEQCKKVFHLKCLALTEEVFKGFSEEYKTAWICPECSCNIPKSGNANTPVRGNVMNQTFTPGNFVNTVRGSRLPQVNKKTESDDVVLDELRQFRLDITARLDAQQTTFKQLNDTVQCTVSQMKILSENMREIQEKVTKIDKLETLIRSRQVQVQVPVNKEVPPSSSVETNIPPPSFASIVSKVSPTAAVSVANAGVTLATKD